MLSTPIVKSTDDPNMMAPFVMNLVGRILEGNVIFINFEESGLPYVTDRNGYVFDRESFESFFGYVRQWYDSMSDEDIDLYNRLLEFENLICVDVKSINSKDARPGYVYFIKAETGQYKVGRTKNVPDRMNFFGVKLPFEFELILTLPVVDMYSAEKVLHDLWKSRRVNGEWFDLEDHQVEFFKQRLGQYDYFSAQASTK